jgi:general stress protein CsbA
MRLTLDQWLADLVVVLRRMAPVLLIAAVGSAMLFAVPQVTDILRSFLLDPLNPAAICFELAVFLWAFELWYSGSILLDITDIPFANVQRGGRIMGALVVILGIVPFPAAAFAYLAAQTKGDRNLLFLLVMTAVECALMIFLMIFRNKLFRGLSDIGPAPRKISIKTRQEKIKWGFFFGSIALFFLLTAVILLSRIGFPQWIGTNALLMIFLSCVAPVVVGLIYLIRNHYLPLGIGLVLILAGFSFINNNHGVRVLHRGVPNAMLATHIRDQSDNPVLDRFTNWAKDRRPPYFIVCLEGGGIRSAYWTSLLLSSIEETSTNRLIDRLSDHVFVLSGVSGGSVGGSVYLALLAEWQKSGTNRPFPMAEDSRRVLGFDLLSPVAAAFLYPDCFQRFLPVPIDALDRARFLENAMEKAWQSAMKSDFFSESYISAWRDAAGSRPALLLNSTYVEEGTRVIVSPFRFNDWFNNSHDFFGEHPAYEPLLSYSTAVFLSARFPLITPTARIYDDPAKHGMFDAVWGHLADGGYFENSGAATAFDILAAIYDPGKNRIYTRKDALAAAAQTARNIPSRKNMYVFVVRDDEPSQLSPAIPFYEIGHPVKTFLDTWTARTPYSEEVLSDVLNSDHVLDVNMYLSGKEVPLGWYLSGYATNAVSMYVRYLVDSALEKPVDARMKNALASHVTLSTNADAENIETLRRVFELLGGK